MPGDHREFELTRIGEKEVRIPILDVTILRRESQLISGGSFLAGHLQVGQFGGYLRGAFLGGTFALRRPLFADGYGNRKHLGVFRA